jgi:hypothetical protein
MIAAVVVAANDLNVGSDVHDAIHSVRWIASYVI